MRIAVVRPGMTARHARDALQPLVFSLLKALTPAAVDLTFHDGLVERLPDVVDADALALTVDTFAARSAYALADRARARGVRVVMGGYHPSAVPDEAAGHADAVVVGDAEDTWPAVVADLAAGRLRSRYTSGNDAPLVVRGDDTAFDRRRYPPLGLVQFSRGCRWSCEFCSIHAFYGAHVRTRPLDLVLDDVRRRPERHLFFVDDNLFADRDRAVELFGALVGAGKRWACQISMDVAEDPALLRLMRRAGCFLVLMGFESLDAGNLRQMGKGANLHASYGRVLDRVRAAGLMVYGTFVVGYDHDTPSTAPALVDFATRQGFSVANFNPLMPMPGTRLHDRLAAEGRLLHDRWWLDPGYRYGDALLRPRGLTPDELTAGCRDARRAFYAPGSIGRRALAPVNRRPENLPLHLATNLVSRHEIRAKQGRPLGVPVGSAR